MDRRLLRSSHSGRYLGAGALAAYMARAAMDSRALPARVSTRSSFIHCERPLTRRPIKLWFVAYGGHNYFCKARHTFCHLFTKGLALGHPMKIPAADVTSLQNDDGNI